MGGQQQLGYLSTRVVSVSPLDHSRSLAHPHFRDGNTERQRSEISERQKVRDHGALGGGPGPQSLPRKATPAASPTYNRLRKPGFHHPLRAFQGRAKADLLPLVHKSTGERGPTHSSGCRDWVQRQGLQAGSGDSVMPPRPLPPPATIPLPSSGRMITCDSNDSPPGEGHLLSPPGRNRV